MAVGSLGDVAGGIVALAVLVAAAGVLASRFGHRFGSRDQPTAASEPLEAAPISGDAPAGRLTHAQAAAVAAAGARLEPILTHESPPRSAAQLLENRDFADALDKVRATNIPTDELIHLAAGHDAVICRVVLPLLAERDDVPERWLLMALRRITPAPWDLAGFYALSLERFRGEVIGNLLSKTDDLLDGDLAEVIRRRFDAGREKVDAELMRRHVPLSMAPQIQRLLDEQDLPEDVRQTFAAWCASTIDFGEVEQFVRVWTRPFSKRPVLAEGRRLEIVEALAGAIVEEPKRSIILVGEHGVGKTALLRTALDSLPPAYLVFEAGATQINAGASYVGQLEGRVEELVKALAGRDGVWVFPSLEEALYAGVYTGHPTGLLDALLPHVEAGAIRLVAEVSPPNYELLLGRRPRVAGAFDTLRVPPMSRDETVRLLRHQLAWDDRDVETSDDALAEAYELAQQFIPSVAAPGGAVALVDETADRVAARGEATLEAGDLLATLATVSGLPLALLDPSHPLDLEKVKAFFSDRVLGQEEAIAAVVDRIALVKAGLTDPTRPLGVFLFVGPTGTGKTELAKALAAFVFGSVSRLVRLDMSEFQTPERSIGS